jgi:DNA polymerase
MAVETITVGRDYDTWRKAARAMVLAGRRPEELLWCERGDAQLLLVDEAGAVETAGTLRVPREFGDLAYDVFHHRSAGRFAVLYRLLWRLTHGERNLLKVTVDDDVHQAEAMQRQVCWDAHRMSGFVRFERTEDEEGELFVAWYRPDHYVVEMAAGGFVRRFGAMRWSILTPDDSAHWDRKRLRIGPGVQERPKTNDELVGLWQTYYRNTYNPQRDNPKLFRQNVPTRFLRDMPEGEAAALLLKT